MGKNGLLPGLKAGVPDLRKKMDFLQKEVYLTNFALENMQALGNCNATVQAIIDYNKAQQGISK